MSSHYLRIFQQPKSAILLILGFASGLPLALTSGTLQAWMTVENIDLKTIGFFSLVGQARLADEGEEANGFEIDILNRHPGLQRAGSEREG